MGFPCLDGDLWLGFAVHFLFLEVATLTTLESYIAMWRKHVCKTVRVNVFDRSTVENWRYKSSLDYCPMVPMKQFHCLSLGLRIAEHLRVFIGWYIGAWATLMPLSAALA